MTKRIVALSAAAALTFIIALVAGGHEWCIYNCGKRATNQYESAGVDLGTPVQYLNYTQDSPVENLDALYGEVATGGCGLEGEREDAPPKIKYKFGVPYRWSLESISVASASVWFDTSQTEFNPATHEINMSVNVTATAGSDHDSDYKAPDPVTMKSERLYELDAEGNFTFTVKFSPARQSISATADAAGWVYGHTEAFKGKWHAHSGTGRATILGLNVDLEVVYAM